MEHKCKSGIYLIRNTQTGTAYVGSALNIARRWVQHRDLLEAGKHPSRHLQNAWSKYGKDTFVFEIAECLDAPEDLLPREQYWIDVFRAASKCYNLAPTAGSLYGHRWTDEQKTRLSNAVKKMHQDPAYQKKFKAGRKRIGKRLSDAAKERWADPEFKARVAASLSNEWDGFVSPDGTEYRRITNLKAFCRANGLDMANMTAVDSGKLQQHKGWRRIDRPADAPKPRATYQNHFQFVSPNGELFETDNLAQFCRERRLDATTMSKVAAGKVKVHRGWHKPA